jgi:hypothetical protein
MFVQMRNSISFVKFNLSSFHVNVFVPEAHHHRLWDSYYFELNFL